MCVCRVVNVRWVVRVLCSGVLLVLVCVVLWCVRVGGVGVCVCLSSLAEKQRTPQTNEQQCYSNTHKRMIMLLSETQKLFWSSFLNVTVDHTASKATESLNTRQTNDV